MGEASKQHIKGLIYLIPLLVVILLLAYLAEPSPRYRRADVYAPLRDTTHVGDSVVVRVLQPFDPNEADLRTLLDAGVDRGVAVSIIRWREAGKVYRIKEDVALCHGITDSLYFALEPYINIGEKYRYHRVAYDDYSQHDSIAVRDSVVVDYREFMLDTVTSSFLRTLGFTLRQAELVVRYRDMIGGYRSIEEFAECYAVDSAMAARLEPYIIFPAVEPRVMYDAEESIFPVEINSADSATLIRVRGIGSKSVVHILRYRELLGGYYSCEQISELAWVTDENFAIILPQICCDSAKIKKININFATSNELKVHPYISNRMLKRIINNRELKGGWSTIEEMIEDDIFSEDEAARIAPYLDFGTRPE